MALEGMSLDNKIALCKEAIEKLTQKLTELEKEKRNGQHTRFIPNIGEHYAYVSCDGIKDAVCTASSFDSDLICFNNTFRPSSAVNLEKYLSDVIRMQNRLMQLHEELCPEFWERDCDKSPFEIYYSYCNNKWSFISNPSGYCIPFSRDAAAKVVNILNEEKFMIGDKNK